MRVVKTTTPANTVSSRLKIKKNELNIFTKMKSCNKHVHNSNNLIRAEKRKADFSDYEESNGGRVKIAKLRD